MLLHELITEDPEALELAERLLALEQFSGSE